MSFDQPTFDDVIRGAPTYSVPELTEQLRSTITERYPDLWIHGEIRNLSRSRAGHVYFDLVEPTEAGREPDASISVVLFRARKEIVNQTIRQAGGSIRMSDGVRVQLRGTLDFYPPQGRLQVLMTGIDPSYTIGQLEVDRARLLATLADEGVLERNRSLAIPLVPLRVGLVTRADSAAYADFVNELAASGYAFQVTAVDTAVQGLGAAQSLAAAIRTADRCGVDVVAVVRGGGARTDLAAFDSEQVARAVVACSVPVITGVGHEIDRSVADEVAHTSTKTPTACAAVLIDAVGLLVARTDDAWAAIAAAAHRRTTAASAALDTRVHLLARRTERAVVGPRDRLTRIGRDLRHRSAAALGRATSRLEHRQAELPARAGRVVRLRHDELDRWATMVSDRAGRVIDTATRRLALLDAQARLYDPDHALARGWSITRTDDGRVVRSAAALAPGDRLVTTVADGDVRSTVDRTTPSEPTDR